MCLSYFFQSSIRFAALSCVYFWESSAPEHPPSEAATSDERTHVQKYHTQRPGQPQKTSTEFEFEFCWGVFHTFFIISSSTFHLNCISYAMNFHLECHTRWNSTLARMDFPRISTNSITHICTCVCVCVCPLINSILDTAAVGQRTHRPTYFSCRYYSLDWRAESAGRRRPLRKSRLPNAERTSGWAAERPAPSAKYCGTQHAATVNLSHCTVVQVGFIYILII